MNYLSDLIFVATLAAFQLILWLVLKVLTAMQVAPRQKMFVFRTGLILFLATPVIFILFKIFSVNTINISIAPVSFDPATMKHSEIPRQPETFSLAYIIFMTYVTGAIFSLAKLVSDYTATWKWLRHANTSELQDTPVRLSEQIQSPLSFGFIFPEIYFPKNAENLWSARDIQLSLQHEKTHIANNDPFWKIISLVVRSILFFVPWAYALHRQLELEIEICCDEITRKETGASLEEYGNLLIAMIAPQKSPNTFNNQYD